MSVKEYIVIIFIIIVIIFYRLSMLKPAKKKGLHTSNTGLGNTTTRMFYHYLFILFIYCYYFSVQMFVDCTLE